MPGLPTGVLLLLLLVPLPRLAALDNGVGLKPALGFNTWNAFGTKSAHTVHQASLARWKPLCATQLCASTLDNTCSVADSAN